MEEGTVLQYDHVGSRINTNPNVEAEGLPYSQQYSHNWSPFARKASPVHNTLALQPSKCMVFAQGPATATQCTLPAPAVSLSHAIIPNGGTSF